MNDNLLVPISASKRLESLRKITQLNYILYAFSWFSFGLTSVIATIIIYIKYEDTFGTVYESHFRWQKNTFWWALLWCSLNSIFMLIYIGYLFFAIISIWVIYRIVKGWLYLNDSRAIGFYKI